MQRSNRHFDNIIRRIRERDMALGERHLRYAGGSVVLFYIKQLTDRSALAEQVIRPLMQCDKSGGLTAEQVAENVIFADDCLLDNNTEKVEQYILDGMTVLLFSGDNRYLVINLKTVEKRNTTEPVMAYTIRGPRDALVENLDSNLSLLRYRLKSDNLRVDMLRVGRRNHTMVAVVYFEDIANAHVVSEIKKRIGKIDVDGLSSSGELQTYLLNPKPGLFPQMGIVERSDMACGAILEGKVVVIMDGSPWALVAPKVFAEYLWTCDDFYLNKFFGIFLRILRVIAMNMAFVVSSLYVAIVSFHSDTLPSAYMIAIAQSRAKVPFSALVEVLFIELIGEIIHESLIRVPTKIGVAIGIVGAIIIGQAAVAAGVFSPLILIVISLSLISSFVPADYTIMDPLRILKYLLILATGTFGLYGFTLVIIFVLAQLVSTNSFGVPFTAPLAPFNLRDFVKSFIYSKSTAPYRANFLRTQDNTRGPVKPKDNNKPGSGAN